MEPPYIYESGAIYDGGYTRGLTVGNESLYPKTRKGKMYADIGTGGGGGQAGCHSTMPRMPQSSAGVKTLFSLPTF